MSVKSAAILWAVIILAMATLTLIDILPAKSMAWILPILSLGSVIHMNALRRNELGRNQATGEAGCGC
jgi:hypothetical protein